MSRIKIAQVLSLDAPGGTELMGLSVFPRLDQDRFEVEVASTGRQSSLGGRFEEAGLSVRYFNNRTVRGLFRVARSGGYDLVHFYGFRASAIGRLVFWLASHRTKRVVGVRHLYPYDRFVTGGWRSRLLDAFERAVARITHGYIANSQGAAERLVKENVPVSKVAYVANGLDLSEWPEEGRARDNDPPVIVCAARFVPFKRHGDLIDALALLAKETNFHCRFVGSGPLEADLVSQVRRYGLQDRVEFAGQLSAPDVRKVLQEADIFVLTSENEGMPRSVMEAMACGLPVVATDVNGSNDLVVDSETGLLTSLGNPQSIAEGLRSLLRDGHARRAMGRAGRRRIAEHFSLDACVRAVEQSYEALYESRPLPGPVPPAAGTSGSSKG